ncbi:sorting and assembly machinery component 50 [Mitosporidium daphniae]
MNGESLEIGKIRVTGADRTNHALLVELFDPLFQCKSVSEINEAISNIDGQMQAFEITKKPLSVSLEFSSSNRGPKVPVNLVVAVDEKSLTAKTGTEWRHNEITMNAGCSIHNVFGKGEKIDASFDLGKEYTSPFNFTFSKNLFFDRNIQFRTFLFSSTNERENHLVKEHHRFCHRSSFSWIKGSFSHIFSFGSVERTLSAPVITEDAISSFKSSIGYLFKYDTRNDPLLPSYGKYFHASSECSLLDQHSGLTVKNELSSQFHFPILSLGGCFGLIFPSHVPQNTLSFIDDKFFLGGPTSVRLFPLRSLGPQITMPEPPGKISTGGDLSAAFGVSFSFPIVSDLESIVRGHIWTNFGHLSNYHWRGENLSGISFGSGIIFKIFNIARLEANFGWRFTADKRESLSSSFVGPSLGISTEFL